MPDHGELRRQADEVRTVIAYDQANLLPSSATAGSGDGALSATTSTSAMIMSARPTTVDGPLSGSADTARTRYNVAGADDRTISPDPDGAGALKHRARRISYNSDGQVEPDRDRHGRQPVRRRLGGVRGAREGAAGLYVGAGPPCSGYVSGGTTYALTQTSYDALGRVDCVAQRMNSAEFASLPASACTLDTGAASGPTGSPGISTTRPDSCRRTRVALGTADEARRGRSRLYRQRPARPS